MFIFSCPRKVRFDRRLVFMRLSSMQSAPDEYPALNGSMDSLNSLIEQLLPDEMMKVLTPLFNEVLSEEISDLRNEEGSYDALFFNQESGNITNFLKSLGKAVVAEVLEHVNESYDRTSLPLIQMKSTPDHLNIKKIIKLYFQVYVNREKVRYLEENGGKDVLMGNDFIKYDSELGFLLFMSRLKRLKKPARTLIAPDIDDFHLVNDVLGGHDMGDIALRYVATVIAQCVRNDESILVRFGGEEFGIISSDDLSAACVIAERIRLFLEKNPMYALVVIDEEGNRGKPIQIRPERYNELLKLSQHQHQDVENLESSQLSGLADQWLVSLKDHQGDVEGGKMEHPVVVPRKGGEMITRGWRTVMLNPRGGGYVELNKIPLECSFGVNVWPFGVDNKVDADKARKQADLDLYLAKENGRNTVFSMSAEITPEKAHDIGSELFISSTSLPSQSSVVPPTDDSLKEVIMDGKDLKSF